MAKTWFKGGSQHGKRCKRKKKPEQFYEDLVERVNEILDFLKENNYFEKFKEAMKEEKWKKKTQNFKEKYNFYKEKLSKESIEEYKNLLKSGDESSKENVRKITEEICNKLYPRGSYHKKNLINILQENLEDLKNCFMKKYHQLKNWKSII